jgi:hypothetical protein
MKSVLIGVDYIKNTDGIKLLELNTDIQISNLKASYFDHDVLMQYLATNNLTKIHIIYKEIYTSPLFIGTLKEKCLTNNIEYFETKISVNSILIDEIADDTETLFLRLAYNAQAILDEYYCRENGELINLLFENGKESYIPKTYLQYSNELLHDNVDSINNNGNYPNIIVKKNYSDANKTLYPAFYNLSNETELNNLKSNLPNNIFLQEYLFSSENIESDLIVNHIRKWYIIANSMEDVVDCGGYLHSNQVPLNNDNINYTDSKLDNAGRAMFYSNPNRLSSAGVISHYKVNKLDSEQNYQPIEVSQIEYGDTIQALNIDTLDVDMAELKMLEWRYTGSVEDLMTYTTASVVRNIKYDIEDWFNKIEYISANQTTGSFLLQMNKMVLTEKDGIVKFTNAQDLEVGINVFNTTNSVSAITAVGNEYFSGSIYLLDIEPIDVFIAGTADNEILNSTIIMHNFK